MAGDDPPDLEKQSPVLPSGAEHDLSAKEVHGPIRTSSHSSSSSSVDSDPLAPLEHALSRPLSAFESEPGPALEDAQDEDEDNLPVDRSRSRTSITSSASRPADFEVTLEPDDPENPRNWPLWYRAWIVFTVSYATWVVVLYSTSYTATIPGVMAEFGVASRSVATLGLTSYLLGLAAGCVVVAPMSELYGRRVVYLVCLGVFVVLIVPCGLARSLAEMVVVRFFGALFGAAMISNSPGTVVDIAAPEYLALCLSWFGIAPLNGPVTGPLIGGYVYENLGWRWANWLALILAGAALVMVATVKETYPPTLLKAKAARLRSETGDDRWWCRHDDRRISTLQLLKTNLSRPFVLAATEPILWFFNIWISVIYGILYLCFIAYPIVFTQHRGWSVGASGLAFAGIGAGTLLAIVLEPLWRRLINRAGRHKTDPSTGRAAPEATAVVMCLGAVLTPVGQLVFSFTCLPASAFPAAVPIVAAGVPFGMGNTLCFIYGSNYLAGAYGSTYAASALAGNAVARSVFGAALPLAGPAMYAALTPRWAGALLGMLEVLLVPIPFVFYRHGDRIRDRSRIITLIRDEMARAERRRVRLAAPRDRDRAAAAEGRVGKGG